MKYLIVGLGNIGQEYAGTRHNIGFEVIDWIAMNGNVTMETDRLGDVGLLKHKGRQIYLLKPSTYMNLSGKSVKYWMDKLKVPVENVLVLLDELQLPFGTQRLRGNGSDGGHNGLKNINLVLNTNNYPRLRIGIGSDFQKGAQVNYVLGKWSDDEVQNLREILDYAGQTVLSFCTAGIKPTMEVYNRKKEA